MKFKIFIFILIISLAFEVSAVPITSFSFNTTGGNVQLTESSIVRSYASIFQVLTDRNVLCKYTKNYGTPYEAMEGGFDFNFGTIHKKNILDLTDGPHTYYVGCRNSSDSSNNILTATFNAITPVSARISLSSSVPVKSGLINLNLVTSKPVQSIPSLSYSFNGVSYNSIALSGQGTNWQGHLIIPVTAGESVCSFLFNAQDLEGNNGNQITEGSVFLVDTIKPSSLIDLDAVGYKGRIDLNWYSLDDDVLKYKIYRSISSGVGYSDFYRETNDLDSFSDSSVDGGKTYYYRVIPVDLAGNEGDFSIEVYATALLNEQNISTGLAPQMIGQVDNMISSISLFINDVENIESSIKFKSGEDKFLFEGLALNDEIKNSKSELLSLKSDVSKYKLQALTQSELTSKLQAAELKINTIKKKIPEDILVLESKETSNSVSEFDIEKLILEIKPSTSTDSLRYKLEKSLSSIENSDFDVKTKVYNFEIVYMDGSRIKKAFVSQDISNTLGDYSNLSIIEVIPKDLASSTSEMVIKTQGYQILKDDPIISFRGDVKKIEYLINSNVDLGLISELRTIMLYNQDLADKNSKITGYFSLVEITDVNYGVYFGLLILLSLFIYLYYLRNSKKKNLIKKVKKQVFQSIDNISKGNKIEAKKIYNELAKFYSSLDEKNKLVVYSEITELRRKLE